mgnify:CR=1 FL=1
MAGAISWSGFVLFKIGYAAWCSWAATAPAAPHGHPHLDPHALRLGRTQRRRLSALQVRLAQYYRPQLVLGCTLIHAPSLLLKQAQSKSKLPNNHGVRPYRTAGALTPPRFEPFRVPHTYISIRNGTKWCAHAQTNTTYRGAPGIVWCSPAPLTHILPQPQVSLNSHHDSRHGCSMPSRA